MMTLSEVVKLSCTIKDPAVLGIVDDLIHDPVASDVLYGILKDRLEDMGNPVKSQLVGMEKLIMLNSLISHDSPAFVAPNPRQADDLRTKQNTLSGRVGGLYTSVFSSLHTHSHVNNSSWHYADPSHLGLSSYTKAQEALKKLGTNCALSPRSYMCAVIRGLPLLYDTTPGTYAGIDHTELYEFLDASEVVGSNELFGNVGRFTNERLHFFRLWDFLTTYRQTMLRAWRDHFSPSFPAESLDVIRYVQQNVVWGELLEAGVLNRSFSTEHCPSRPSYVMAGNRLLALERWRSTAYNLAASPGPGGLYTSRGLQDLFRVSDSRPPLPSPMSLLPFVSAVCSSARMRDTYGKLSTWRTHDTIHNAPSLCLNGIVNTTARRRLLLVELFHVGLLMPDGGRLLKDKHPIVTAKIARQHT